MLLYFKIVAKTSMGVKEFIGQDLRVMPILSGKWYMKAMIK
jgi:hypothetical protein